MDDLQGFAYVREVKNNPVLPADPQHVRVAGRQKRLDLIIAIPC